MELIDKLSILADAAKYDASCASSGAPKRSSEGKSGLGASNGMGICHSYTPDGRCVSLLKILLTNFCLYDCQYCVNRRSSDVPRARFTPEEVVTLTMDFYRRNCVSGLFLSSGIIRSADYTMEQLIRVARLLREEHEFRGYIHLKTIPEADPALIEQAGRYADRLSVNIELPTDASLQTLAPEKHIGSIKGAMQTIYTGVQTVLNEPRAPRFAPAGQSTQMIVGADDTDDSTILHSAQSLYGNFKLRRVYYSAFSPIPDSPKSVPLAAPPLMREHRLYQADFLLRSYGYTAGELFKGPGHLALDIDPKLAWALENRDIFPLDLNRAEASLISRIPGIGLRTTERLVELRRQRRIRYEDLARMRCVLAKAKPFFITSDYHPQQAEVTSHLLYQQLRDRPQPQQMGLWGMINLDCDDLFETWRLQARWLLSHEVDPSLVAWASEGVQDLFASDHALPESQGPFLARIPRLLLDTLEQAARYRGDQRWSLLYEVLWRVSHGDRTAMMSGDKLGSELQRRIKQVQRESHHLHAFVRFVELPGCVGPQYVAWHEPAHDILHSASEHFIGRMGRHRWMIATPRDGVYYDGEQLNYLRQCPEQWQQMAQNVDDPHGDMWLTYYSHIFNPARLNPKVMQGHLPTRFWKNLPEALIPGLITQARTGKQQDGQASGIKGRQGKRIGQTKMESSRGTL